MDNDAKNLLLPVGTPVGPYIIRRHLGQNQCSATYLVEDTRKSGSFLWMIESLPVSLVKRSGSAVAPRQRKLAPVLQQAHASFVKSMREASMRPLRELHRGYSALQANGTNYVLLMPPSGTSLQEWMNSYAATPADHVRRFMDASLKALSAIHAAGLLHLDISPSTLFLHNNTVLFCGYGQPRQLLAQLCERPLTTPYYSAPELGNYATPPTAAADIFSLGATMRSLITRKSLPALRSAGDGLLLLSADDRLTRVYGAPLLACIDKALAVQPECRWQSVEEWALCLAEGRVPELIGMSAAEPSVEELPLDFTPPPAVKAEPVTGIEPMPKQEEPPTPVKVTTEATTAPVAKETPQQAPAPMEEESPRKPELTSSPIEEPKQEAPAPEPVAPPTVAPASPEPDAPAPVKTPEPRAPKAEEKPAEKVETPQAEEHSIYDLMEKKNRNRKVTICAALAVLGLGVALYAWLKDTEVPVGGDIFAPTKAVREGAEGKTEKPAEQNKPKEEPVAGPSAKDAPVLPLETTISLPVPEPTSPVVVTPPVLPDQPAEQPKETEPTPATPDTPVAGNEPQPSTPTEPAQPTQPDTPVADNEPQQPQFPDDQPTAPTPTEPTQPAQPDTPVVDNQPQPTPPTDIAAEPVSDFEALVQQAQQPGNGKAMLQLAQAYAEGKGTEKNDKKAYKWFYEASQKANGAQGEDLSEARYQTGLCYLQGKGTARRPKEAAFYFTLAAEKGHAQAQYNLGKCYLEGIGVKKANKDLARRWLNKAAQKGVQEAKELLKSPSLREEPADTRRSNRRTRH